MYSVSVPNRDSPPAVLLRESNRENGKVRKRTRANLSCLSTEVVEGLTWHSPQPFHCVLLPVRNRLIPSVRHRLS